MSNSKAALHAALFHIQQNLVVPKNRRNDFGGFNYRSLEDITNALKPLLAETGMVFYFEDELVPSAQGDFVKATAHLCHVESGECLSIAAPAKVAIEKGKMDVSQMTGSASSYARKYAANAMFLLDDCQDPDTNAHTEARQGKQSNYQGQGQGRNQRNPSRGAQGQQQDNKPWLNDARLHGTDNTGQPGTLEWVKHMLMKGYDHDWCLSKLGEKYKINGQTRTLIKSLHLPQGQQQ